MINLVNFDKLVETHMEELGVSKEDILDLFQDFFSELSESLMELRENIDDKKALDPILHNLKGILLNLKLEEQGEQVGHIYNLKDLSKETLELVIKDLAVFGGELKDYLDK